MAAASERSMKGRRKVTSVYLDVHAFNDLAMLSESTRIPQAAYIREAVADLLRKYSKELRRAKS